MSKNDDLYKSQILSYRAFVLNIFVNIPFVFIYFELYFLSVIFLICLLFDYRNRVIFFRYVRLNKFFKSWFFTLLSIQALLAGYYFQSDCIVSISYCINVVNLYFTVSVVSLIFLLLKKDIIKKG